MGAVWRAHDELLNRDVAVKEIIWPPQLNPDERETARRRAFREAQMAARLSHPNVVGVFDIVEEDDRPWIVMELVPFRSLRDTVLADGPLSPARAARIGQGILAALQAAHQAGVLHRDVKPANILLGPDGRVVLTDFGIARAVDSPALTSAGVLIGSPSYLSPERARGGAAGQAGDLWALGASLYAAVEGRPPFDRGRALASLTAVVTDAPDPSRHAGPLWPVISGLLRKDPAERLNAAEVERMLRRIAEEAPADGRAMAAPRIPGPAEAEPGPAEAEPGPAEAEPAPAKAEPAPAKAGPRPAEAEPRPAEAEPGPAQAPAAAAEPEPRSAEAEAGAAEAPAGPAEAPAAAAQAPAAAAQAPAGTAEAPAGTAEAPAGTAEAPAGTGHGADGGRGADGTDPSPDTGNSGPATGPEDPRADRTAPVAPAAPAARRVADRGRPRGARRHRTVVVAASVVAIAAVAVVVALALVTNTPPGHPSAHSGTRPTPKGSASPSASASRPASTAPSGSASAGSGSPTVLPAGYYRFTNSTGFSIGVPRGWQISHDGHYVYIRDPANAGIFLLIDQSDHPQPNPLADWQQQAANRHSSYPDYRLIRLKSVHYTQAEKAADWEFTYDRNGVPVHILNRNVLANADHAYALYWSTPASDWTTDYHYFQTFAATFRPAPASQGG